MHGLPFMLKRVLKSILRSKDFKKDERKMLKMHEWNGMILLRSFTFVHIKISTR
jgi:hypothetical protein